MRINNRLLAELEKNNGLHKDYFQHHFEQVKTHIGTTHLYPQGNCHNVVHLVSLVLKHYHIAHQKIWIYAPCRLKGNASKEIELNDPNHISLNGQIAWGYHVALLLRYGLTYSIFDFMLNDQKPIYLSEWIKGMNIDKYKIEVLNPKKYLFFTNKYKNKPEGIINGRYFEYKGLCKRQKWLQKGLAINETANAFYTQETDTLTSLTEAAIDFKLFVGNIFNFELVLRDHTHNDIMSMAFQEKYANTILKYRTIYHSNLEKWNEKLLDLI
jgi:hypothetical protein